MKELQATSFHDEHKNGNSSYIVGTADGELAYDYTTSVSLPSVRHIYGALDDFTRYTFSDANGILIITPKGEEQIDGLSITQLMAFHAKLESKQAE